MNNKIKFLALGLGAFVLGFGVNNLAMSDVPCNCKLAVVDVQQVIASSAQVAALKKEQQAKAEEIVKYLENARKDVAAVTDEKKKQSLEEKYTKELNAKRETMEKDYAKKLQDIDKSITEVISNQAKLDSYTMVISKSVVLYGGTDITDRIKKVVK